MEHHAYAFENVAEENARLKFKSSPEEFQCRDSGVQCVPDKHHTFCATFISCSQIIPRSRAAEGADVTMDGADLVQFFLVNPVE
jgi:Zn finger protein HypA/HybF involved in hydrogenase expression